MRLRTITTLGCRAGQVASLSLLLQSALCMAAQAGETNWVTLATTSLRGTTFACRTTEDRLLADRKWEIVKEPIPLEPAKAFSLASGWARKNAKRAPLLRIEILPLETLAEKLQGHYAYIFHFRMYNGWDPAFEAAVAVLMDGTVIEPH